MPLRPQKNHEVLNFFLKFFNQMKEEAQGFPTACGSMGFRLHPKALEVSEKVKHFGKSNFTKMGNPLVIRSPGHS